MEEINSTKFEKVNFAKFTKFWWLGLLLIIIVLTVYFRIQPEYMSITDSFAENILNQNIANQISTQVNQQYPNLPEQNRQTLIANQLAEVQKSSDYASNKQIISQQLKDYYKHPDGYPYLGDIDSYYYYRLAQNTIENSQPGTEQVGGEYCIDSSCNDIIKNYNESQTLAYSNIDFTQRMYWDGERMAPNGAPVQQSFWPLVMVWSYKVIHVFDSEISLMRVVYFLPMICAILGIICIFFLGKLISNNWFGGFFAALVISLNPTLISRTVLGSTDSDAIIFLFMCVIPLLFYLALSTKREIITKKLGTWNVNAIYACLAGVLTAIFSYTWNTGWWFTFDIIFGAAILYIIYLKLTKNSIKNEVYYLVCYLTFVIMLTLIFNKFDYDILFSTVTDPLYRLTGMSEVAISTVWPNIQTTVAELNPSSLTSVISSIGGNLLFFVGIISFVLLLFKNKCDKLDIKYLIFLFIWFFIGLFTSLKGGRFILLLAPCYALMIGTTLGILINKVTEIVSTHLKQNKILVKFVMIVFCLLLILSTFNTANQAKNQLPLINDAWWNSLKYIENNSNSTAIINSWWDYGHWFITIANRRTTFDGSGQDRYMAYWIGRVLYTSDEDLAVGILRMVDCGNNNAFWQLDKSINKTYRSIDILNDIVKLDRNSAKQYLLNYIGDSESEKVLQYTHCNPPEDFFITSGDMVGKAGVWSHFGSWDFYKATMYNELHDKSQSYAEEYMIKEFGLADTEQTYYEIQTVNANHWISQWYGYGQTMNCQDDNTRNGLICNGYIYDQITLKMRENESIIMRNEQNIQILFCNPEIKDSIFSRLYFLGGKGLNHFNLAYTDRELNGGYIYVWKINWEKEK